MKILDTYFIIYCNTVRSILMGFIYYLDQFPQKKKKKRNYVFLFVLLKQQIH